MANLHKKDIAGGVSKAGVLSVLHGDRVRLIEEFPGVGLGALQLQPTGFEHRVQSY